MMVYDLECLSVVLEFCLPGQFSLSGNIIRFRSQTVPRMVLDDVLCEVLGTKTSLFSLLTVFISPRHGHLIFSKYGY